MGSTYGNFVVVGASQDAVIAALGDESAFVAAESGGAVAVFPVGEAPSSGERLSAELRAPIVGAIVYDDDIFSLTTYVQGELVDEVTVPDPAAHFGVDVQDLVESGLDPAEIGLGDSLGHDPERVVGALGRGDADRLRAALSDDDSSIFASDRHAAVLEALGLPADAAGWGYHYLQKDPELFNGGLLTEVPTP